MPPDVAIPTEPKPGYLTTEFWVTLITLLLPVLTLAFGTDLSSQVPTIAAAAAGLAAVTYSLSRALTKSAQSKAATGTEARTSQQPTPAASDPLVIESGIDPSDQRLHRLARQLFALVPHPTQKPPTSKDIRPYDTRAILLIEG